MQELQFDYYRGLEAEQYTFYRIPKVLFTAECFKSLSCEAKVLYGLLLDRMSLSVKNRWLDEEDRVYIIFTVEEIMEMMCCKTQKAVKLLKELDSEKGIGLIEKKRLGLGRPNVIYVKNFLIKETETPKDAGEAKGEQIEIQHGSVDAETQAQQENLDVRGQDVQNPKCAGIKNQEFQKSKFKNFENQKSGVLKIKSQDFPETQPKNFENNTSRILKIKNQEFRFSKSNNTDFNDTEYSETDHNDTDFNDTDFDLAIPIYPNPIPSSYPIQQGMKKDAAEKIRSYRDIIREQISYKCFQDGHYYRREDVDELVELIGK